MAAVNITAVNVLDNPAPFTNPLQFEIHYECMSELQEGARLSGNRCSRQQQASKHFAYDADTS